MFVLVLVQPFLFPPSILLCYVPAIYYRLHRPCRTLSVVHRTHSSSSSNKHNLTAHYNKTDLHPDTLPLKAFAQQIPTQVSSTPNSKPSRPVCHLRSSPIYQPSTSINQACTHHQHPPKLQHGPPTSSACIFPRLRPSNSSICQSKLLMEEATGPKASENISLRLCPGPSSPLLRRRLSSIWLAMVE